MVEIPASDKEVGDSGHTADHNLITLALVNHDGRITLVEAAIAEMLTADTGFTVELDNTEHTHFFYVELPSGDRSAQPDVLGIYKSGTDVLRADGDGRLHLRSASGGSTSTPLSVRGHTSQTADLTQWRNGSNTILAYVDRQGNIYAPNLTPSGMTNLTLSGGMSWVGNPSDALRPKYWTIGEHTELRGTVTLSGGSSFSFGSGSVQLGSLPSEIGPPFGHQTVCATGGDSTGRYWIKVQVEAPNLGACRIMAHAPADYAPTTIYLDGVRFYRGS